MSSRIQPIVAGTLTALGLATFAYRDITDVTRSSAARAGRSDASIAQTGGVSIPAVFGAIVLVGGLALQLSERKTSRSDPA